MSKDESTPCKRGKKKTEALLLRSSAAEYLTFVAAGGRSEDSVEMRYEDENLWLTQKMMAELYGVSVPAINQHLKRIFSDNELEPEATIKKYLIVQTEGSREVQRSVEHYNLQAIIAVGFKIENERAVQFRKWANQIVKDYTIQGWTMDSERLKQGGTLTDEFFERQLEKIREIRLSERKFYQKITDIYATALDYDPSANLHYFWDLERGNPYLITSFPTPTSVTGYQKTKPDPQRLIEEVVGDDYVVLTQRPHYATEAARKKETERSHFIQSIGLRFLRPYQKQAILEIQRAMKQGKDHFLREMATGTGKTLKSAANRKLITRFEQKIQTTLARSWSEKKQEESNQIP